MIIYGWDNWKIVNDNKTSFEEMLLQLCEIYE
jgi:hypothetical protein